MAFTTPIHTNEQSVDRVLRAGLPVLLVFWRPDCQPCSELNPRLDGLAQANSGKVIIAKVNVDDNPALANRYDVTQLPALVFLREGRVVTQATGAAPEVDVQRWLDAAFRGAPAPSLHGPTDPLHRAPRPEAQSAAQPKSSPSTSNGTAHPMVLTDATFDQIVGQSSLPVLVDFWAPWCGPCRMVAPVVEQLAGEFAGRAVVGKLNVDDHQRIAQRYGIMSIPALYIFKQGQVVERLVGAQPAPVLRQALQLHTR